MVRIEFFCEAEQIGEEIRAEQLQLADWQIGEIVKGVMKKRRWREDDRLRGGDIFEKEMAERIGLVLHPENDHLRRFRLEQLVQDRPLDVAPGARQSKIDDVGVLASLRKILLDSGGAEAELLAGRTDDGDVDRLRVKVDPLIDPAQPAVRILQLPSLIVVFRKKADRRVEDEGDGERRAQNAEEVSVRPSARVSAT